MHLRRLARFGELRCVHIEMKLRITWGSPSNLIMPGQARYSSVQFIYTAIYSVLFRAVPGLEGSVNGVLLIT